jgi:transposase
LFLEIAINPLQTLLSPDPVTLEVRSVTFSDTAIVVILVAMSPSRLCPICDHPSDRVQSRYWRSLADLPIRGVPVRLRLQARRFFGRSRTCRRKVFAERLGDVAHVAARGTRRLHASRRQIGIADGGEKGSRLAQRLGMGASPDSLLRLIRETTPASEPNPRVVGVDEWAKRKGRTDGAIVVDLERHRIADRLEEAAATEFADWLQAHPGVEVIRRDRGGAFAEGGRAGAPDAIQVADRFHLLKNRGDAVEEYLARIHRQLPPDPDRRKAPARASGPRAPEGATSFAISPSRHEQERQRRRARRRERSNAVIALQQQGVSVRQIARSLDLDRQTVTEYLRSDSFPERGPRAKRASRLDPFRAYLRRRWDDGWPNGDRLFRELQERGFPGQRAIVSAGVARLRQKQSTADGAVIQQMIEMGPNRRTSPRQVRWWFQGKPEDREGETRAALERFLAEHPEARVVDDLTQRFGSIVRERRRDDLDGWLADARQGSRALQSFARGITRDRLAVEAALTYTWSQGQTEGQVNRVKLAKRAMFGRGNFDLLRQVVLAAA